MIRLPVAPRFILPAILAAFGALALALALTRAPHTDEGHFASAAAAFADGGRLVMPMWTEWIATLDQRMYAVLPLYFVGLGVWFKSFGVSFVAMRLFSVLWGIILVGSWYAIGREVGRAVDSDEGRARMAGLAVAAFIGLNYDVANTASARYDIMAAGLGAAALATYLLLRARRLGLGIVLSQALVCAACLVHPYGIFGGAGVAIFAVMLDRHRLRPRHLLIAGVPYLIGVGLFGIYVAQDPAMFRAQFSANASGRLGAYTDPLGALASELRQRYLVLLGGWRADLPATARIRLLILLVYAAGVGGCLLARDLRRTGAVRALLLFALAAFLMLTMLESNRWYIYVIHAVPIYAACAGVLAWHVWNTRRWRPVVIGVAAGYALLTVASVAYRTRLDVFGRAFAPVARYLQSHVRTGDLVMAGGEFGVGLGFAEHVLDDARLGFRNGRTPAYVVVGREYAANHRAYRERDPVLARHVDSLLSTYSLVLSTGVGEVQYRVYARNPPFTRGDDAEATR